jgi:predicted transcriptional regulator
MKTDIYFGGFYGSIHSYNIDSQIEQYNEPNEDEQQENEQLLKFDSYKELLILYSKKYIDFLNELIGTDLQFIELYSPREYNFETDSITVDCSDRDLLKAIKYAKENDLKKDIFELIKEDTTARSGYIPFKSYSDLFMSDNRELLAREIFQVICENSDREFDSFYDLKCMYELIYRL